MKDEIIQELWDAKDKIARKHGHHVKRLVKHRRNRTQSHDEG